MTNLLLPRAKSSQYLTLLLAATLAFPANLPAWDRDDGRSASEPLAPVVGRPRSCVHRPERKSLRHHPCWSVDADEAEAPTALDHFRYAPPALLHRPLDLPSLVPAPLDSPPIGATSAVVLSIHRPPLRC